MVTPFARTARSTRTRRRLSRHLLANGSDGLVLAGTTGEGATITDEEEVRLGRSGSPRPAATYRSSPARAATTRGTPSSRPSARTECGVDGALVVAPYYNKPDRRGLAAHFTTVADVHRSADHRLQHPVPVGGRHAERPARRDRRSPNVVAVKQARTEDLAPIDGLDLLAGNDDALAQVLDMGGTGGILVASHLVGPEMRRMIDEPDAARRDPGVAGAAATRRWPSRRPAASTKAALRILGHAVPGRGCRTWISPTARRARFARRSRARACWKGSRPPERHAAHPPARRVRRDRQEHDGPRVRGPDRGRGHRAARSRRPTSSASTSCCPTSPTCASGRPTSTRSS